MRICYLCPDLGITLDGHKGASAHVRGFVRALKLLNHEVVVIASSEDGDAGLGVPVNVISKPDLFFGISMEKQIRMVRALSHVWNNVIIEKVLKETIESFKPELIYERYSPFSVAGSILARQKGIPHILEVNALLAEEGKLYRKQSLQEASEFLEQTAFNSTSLIIAVSHELKDSLISSGIPDAKVVEVPNGVDEMFFTPVETSIRADYKWKIVIGFVGSLKPWHAIDLFADSFRALASNPVYHLLVVGDGPKMKTLRILEKDLPGRVTLTGSIPHNEIPKYIQSMDIAVAPYPEMEKFYFSPLKILEYMALGKAIVATDVGQVRKFIRHGENGLLVSPDDTQSLIDAIRELSKNSTLRQRLGIKAAEEARAFHSWRNRVTFILDFYQSKKLKMNHRSFK